ncbi:MAG: hypothetical protein IJ079_02350 [Lachnospiraceae bacterium]|nr:hypothetical protein [Lachnospiraceae bacterium]
MKKVLIAIAIVAVLLVAVFFLLPQSAKDYVDYYRMQKSNSLTYQKIQECREAIVLSDMDSTNPSTYEDIFRECAEYEYWTNDEVVNTDGSVTTTITGYGSRVTLAYGESGDGGVLQSSHIKFVFLLDGRGGYTLTVFVDDKQLSEVDRNMLLRKMCQLAKE